MGTSISKTTLCSSATATTVSANESNRENTTDKLIVDWSNTIQFTPKQYFCPTTIDELKEILEKHDGPFSTFGSLHSSSGIFVNQHNVIGMHTMPTYCNLSSDRSIVTVSTNMTIRDLLVKLAVSNKALPATGGTDEQTIGGLLGTDTAPSSKTATIYSGLRSVKIVTTEVKESGRKAVVKEVDRTSPMFYAVVANLGAIGILLDATFETVQNQYYHTLQEIGNIDTLLKTHEFVDKDGNNYPFWRISWFPKTDKGLVWAARPINGGNPESDYPKEYSTRILTLAGHNSPFQTLGLRLLYDAAIVAYEVKHTVAEGPLRAMIPVDRFVDQKTYCAIAGFAFLPEDALRAKQVFHNYFESTHWPSLPIETDLAKCDDYYMSPWNFKKIKADATFLVKFNIQYLTATNMDPQTRDKFRQKIVEHVKGLWDALVGNGIKFKAHWGKINFITPDDVKKYYMWDEFKKYVNKQFLNSYLAERLPPLDD